MPSSVATQLYPYTALVEWNPLQPWWDQVVYMESWLDHYVGRDHWRWSHFSMAHAFYCGVAFLHEQDSVLFLLRWSAGVELPSTHYKRPL